MIGPAGGRRTGNLGGWAGFFPGRGSAQRVEKGEELAEHCRTVMRTASVRYVCLTSKRTMNSTLAWDRDTHVRGSHFIELSGRRRLDSIPLPRTPLQSLPPCGRKDTANRPSLTRSLEYSKYQQMPPGDRDAERFRSQKTPPSLF